MPIRYTRGRTGESEYDRETRLRQEMQMRLREEYFGGRGELGRQRLEVQEGQMRMENKMAAEGWELKHSAATRARIAQGNEALQRVKRDPGIAPNEKEAMRQAIMQDMYGVEKTWTPPDPNKPRAPEGHEIGVPFQHNDGGTYAFEINAQGNLEMKIKQRFDQSPEKYKMEAQKTWEEARGKLRVELMREEKEVPGEGDEPPTKKRKYENWEIEELLNAAGYSSANAPLPQGAPQAPQAPPAPPQPQAPLAPQAGPQPQVTMGLPPGAQPAPPEVQPPEPQGQIDTKNPRELIGWTRNIPLTAKERDLPPMVAKAKAFTRWLRGKKAKGEKLDPNMGRAIIEAGVILREYGGGLNVVK